MAVKIQFRRGLASEWTSTNPILSDGELGLETDTGKFKVGDGSNEWSVLEYSSGTQGPQGEQGIQGIQGEQGIQGVKGDTGDQGSQGIQGIQGEPGIQGIQGDKGDKGDKGDTGEQGIQGIQGIKGDTGDTGLQGIQGEKGDKGDTGDQGIQGIQGEQGIQGIQGVQGEQGDPGEGVPAGGSAGQVLTKIDGTDYNTQWSTPESGDPWTIIKLAQDFVTSLSANTAVTGFNFTPQANKHYWILGLFSIMTAATGVGPRPGISWPTGSTLEIGWLTATSSATAFASRNWGAPSTANAASGGLPVINEGYPARLEAMIMTGPSPSGNFQITLATETAGTNVTMRAGSILMYREL